MRSANVITPVARDCSERLERDSRCLELGSAGDLAAAARSWRGPCCEQQRAHRREGLLDLARIADLDLQPRPGALARAARNAAVIRGNRMWFSLISTAS